MATPTESTTAPAPAGTGDAPATLPPPVDPALAGGAPEGAGGAPDPHGLPTAPAPDGTQTSGKSGGTEPNAPQTPTAPASPSVPEPSAAKPGDGTATTKQERQEVTDLPQWAQDLIKNTRDEAGRTRVNAKKEAAAEAEQAAVKKMTEDIGRALGLINDDTPDEDKLTPEELKQLLQGERSTAQNARVELAVYKAAQAGGDFNASALLDSRAFLDSLKGVDPTDTAKLAEKIAEAVQANPWLKQTPTTTPEPTPAGQQPATAPVPTPATPPTPPAPPSGGQFAGGPGAQPQDLSTMSIDDFRKLRQQNAHR